MRQFFATPYGRDVWVSTWLDIAIDWQVIRSLVERSYRTVATQRLLNRMNIPPADRPR
jgi:hypothetical protein